MFFQDSLKQLSYLPYPSSFLNKDKKEPVFGFIGVLKLESSKLELKKGNEQPPGYPEKWKYVFNFDYPPSLLPDITSLLETSAQKVSTEKQTYSPLKGSVLTVKCLVS